MPHALRFPCAISRGAALLIMMLPHRACSCDTPRCIYAVQYAGNVLVYGSISPSEGDWFGSVTAHDAEDLLTSLTEIEVCRGGVTKYEFDLICSTLLHTARCTSNVCHHQLQPLPLVGGLGRRI